LTVRENIPLHITNGTRSQGGTNRRGTSSEIFSFPPVSCHLNTTLSHTHTHTHTRTRARTHTHSHSHTHTHTHTHTPLSALYSVSLPYTHTHTHTHIHTHSTPHTQKYTQHKTYRY